MKRFYKHAGTSVNEAGHGITLDGKPVRTPGGKIMAAPNAALAGLVAQEWSRQDDLIRPESMPLTQILATVLDTPPEARTQIEEAVQNYLDTDLLCYRALHPEEIAVRQRAGWDPWLRRFERESGSELLTTTGLLALKQPPAAHTYIRARLLALDLWRLTAMQMATAISGSVILALAFLDRAANPDEVFAAAHIEEQYRAEIYNEALHGAASQEAQAQAARQRDLQALRQFLDTFDAGAQ